ncbi:GntR family transcriptional regulator [Acholeplasma laidlawii]|uniref:GntR family transcriptional regulator n=1 Tax=Acholeplasma laidlawii TaxID=2148 RepID=UPI0021F7739A|nr:GntR family transcriptional regulator [Acholeplasma laidlawii]
MSNVPIYIKIQNDLKKEMDDGILKNGDLVPSENELKDKYNVTRMTVRQALNNLCNDYTDIRVKEHLFHIERSRKTFTVCALLLRRWKH